MFQFLFSPKGRISRRDIWLKYLLPYIALGIVAGSLDEFLPASRELDEFGLSPVSTLLDLFYLWPSIALSVKRFHDRGMTGWWVVYSILLLIPGFVLVGLGAYGAGFRNATMPTLDPATWWVDSPLFILGCAEILVVALVLFVIQYLLPGQRGENKYGPDPLEGRT